MNDNRSIEISPSIVYKTILIILGIAFLYFIRDVLVLFLVAVFLTAILEPAVDWMHSRGFRRGLSVLVIFFTVALLIALILTLIIPRVISESKSLLQELPRFMENIAEYVGHYAAVFNLNFDKQSFLQNISLSLFSSGQALFSTTVNILTGIISLVVLISLSFYMSAREDAIKNFLVMVTPAQHHQYVASLAERIKTKIGKWMQGQLMLMGIIFFLYFFDLLIIGVPYALILALLGGLMELIPYFGPIIAAIPAIIVGLVVSPLTGLLVLVTYLIIHQIESNIIAPQVMGKAIGVNPVVIILALLIGVRVGGVVGIILSVPVATVISVILSDFFSPKQQTQV